MSSVRTAAVVIAGVLAGCAGEPEKPVEEITQARTLIEQAEQAGAQRYAAADLEMARNKLQQADKAADDGDAQVARRFAAQAAVDARYAMARSSSEEAKRAAEELERSVTTLREEAARGGPAGPDAGGTTTPSDIPAPGDTTSPGTQVDPDGVSGTTPPPGTSATPAGPPSPDATSDPQGSAETGGSPPDSMPLQNFRRAGEDQP